MDRQRCRRCRKTASWTVFRLALFSAAASLGFYIPFKYVTQLHAIEGLYAFLFPLSSVLVIAGISLAARPEWTYRIPYVGRAVLGAIAGGWIATGVMCVPSLTKGVIASPLPGLFAFFHMGTQHVFLSFAVAALVLVPNALFDQFGFEADEPLEPASDRVASEA